MQMNNLNTALLEESLGILPNKEITKIFFHSIMAELSELQEEIGDYTAKEIVFRSLDRIPNIKVEWGDPRIYGKNRVLMGTQEKIAVLDITPVIQALKLVWNTYFSSQNTY